jgi:hypothetical protein
MMMTYRHFKKTAPAESWTLGIVGPIFVINYRLMLRIVLEVFYFSTFSFS